MKKPMLEIEKLRNLISFCYGGKEILAYLDSIPSNAHICTWPEGVTREFLDSDAADAISAGIGWAAPRLRALAAIAPVEKKKEKKRMKVLVTLDFGTHKVGPFEHEYEVTE